MKRHHSLHPDFIPPDIKVSILRWTSSIPHNTDIYCAGIMTTQDNRVEQPPSRGPARRGHREDQSCGVGVVDGDGGVAKKKKRDIMDGLLPDVLQVIEKPKLSEGESNVAISRVESIASYSWTGRDVPTIIVPGEWRHICDVYQEPRSERVSRLAAYLVEPDIPVYSPQRERRVLHRSELSPTA